MADQQILRELITNLLSKCGISNEHAHITADLLIAAELRDIPSHGLLRLADYARMILNGRINPNPNPRILHESPSTILYDGDNGLGPVVSVKAMELAIKKAGQAGTGWVAVQNSNHFGIAAYYSMMALEHDMIGISMTNANPLVAPTFSAEGLLGTNPIAIAVPAGEEPPLVADFATAAIARGKVDLLHKKGMSIAEGFLQDKEGQPATDPGILTKGGAILPLGSTRDYGSHKGYCLAASVDILSAVLSGANFGPFVPPSVAYLPLKDNLPGKGTGHFFGAMRIDAFRTSVSFKKDMDTWIRLFRGATPASGHARVIIPGEPEREAEARNKINGIRMQKKVLEQLQPLFTELGMEPYMDNSELY